MSKKHLLVLTAVFALLLATSVSAAQVNLVELQEKTISGTSILASEAGLLPMEFNEAPALRAMVEAGELPPVAERLPADPAVVIPYDSIGNYGGTWRLATLGVGDGWSFWARHAGLEGLIRFHPTEGLAAPGFYPNVARSWDVSEDGTQFTFYLHQGIRWSDGAPLSAKDEAFWYEDVILNETLNPTPPSWLRPGGTPPAEFEMLDEYTVRFTFEQPYAYFLEMLAGPEGNAVFGYPKHWASRFHGDYADPDELDALLDEYGFNAWDQLFDYMLEQGYSSSQTRPGENVPSIRPYIANTPYGEADYVDFVRNPYYWKVDPAGNQLPYIDRLHGSIVEDSQVIAMMALAGELDFQHRNIPKDAFPILFRNQERGDFTIAFREDNFVHNVLTMGPNLHHRDPAKREIFNDFRFREALSIAIDREEIAEVMYPGQPVEPSQLSTPPGWGGYYEPWAKAYIDYDLDRANALLDEMGMVQRDSSGFRMTPDGQRFAFRLDAVSGEVEHTELAEMVARYWQDLDLNVQMQSLERSYLFDRVAALDFDWAAWHGLFTQPQFEHWAPMGVGTIFHARAEQTYTQTGGREGVAPEGDVLRTLELWQQMSVTMDPAARDELFKEIQAIHKDNLWHISLITDPGYLTVQRNHMRNVPEEFRVAWMNIQPSTLELSQIYIEQ